MQGQRYILDLSLILMVTVEHARPMKSDVEAKKLCSALPLSLLGVFGVMVNDLQYTATLVVESVMNCPSESKLQSALA